MSESSSEVLVALQRAHAEAEEQLVLLQNLYSASLQFLGAKDPGEVVRIVAEVLENLVGAKGFSLFIWRPGERLARPILRRGNSRMESLGPKISDALKLSQPSVFRRADGSLEGVVAPLHYGGELVGAVVIDSLLPQKQGQLSGTDLELLSLLSAQAAPALLRARERTRAESQNAAVELLLQQSERPSGKASIQGDLDETKLIDVIQLIGMTRKSGRLQLTNGDRGIEFQFHDGAVFDLAEGSMRVPLADASQLLSGWVEKEGTFVFYSETPATIPNEVLSCNALLMDALRLYDEQGRGRDVVLPG